MGDKSNIPQFNGASYQAWAFKVRFGMAEKDCHTVAMEWNGMAREPLPAVIVSLTPQEEGALDPLLFRDARATRAAEIVARDAAIADWRKRDLTAQTLILKYLGPSEQMHVRKCLFAHEMWTALKTFYELQGNIEVANA